MSTALVGACLLSLALLTGCETSEPIGEVSGKVTLDGKPVTAGGVIFSNTEKGVHVLVPIKSDGTYQLETAAGYGVPLGTYQVAVSPPIPEPVMPGAPKPEATSQPIVIPVKYQKPGGTGLETTITNGTNTYDIKMESK